MSCLVVNFSKYKFKNLLTKDPNKTTSREYIKQQIKQYRFLLLTN